ncbi:MAG TPA: hypothetical protein VL991_14465 [Terracidiphilus sp.]|jgi:hypothetical protein|nr:hypothetical protein [Terracidiphilus sp.]
MISKRNFLLTLAALVLVPGVSRAQSSQTLSRAELHKMIAAAHSPEQYHELASYFRWRQEVLQEEAHAELIEWDRRSQIAWSIAEKYPRPVDSSRNRYEYFRYEEQQMSQKAAYYERLSEIAAR